MPDAPEGGHSTQAGALPAGPVLAPPEPEAAELEDEEADEARPRPPPDRLPAPPDAVPVVAPVPATGLVVPPDAAG